MTAPQTSNGCGLRETDDGIIFMYLKQKIRKGSLPRYQQFLSDEDRRTWEYQQITQTGEETWGPVRVNDSPQGAQMTMTNPEWELVSWSPAQRLFLRSHCLHGRQRTQQRHVGLHDHNTAWAWSESMSRDNTWGTKPLPEQAQRTDWQSRYAFTTFSGRMSGER